MTRLFDLLPALYRLKDAGIAQSQALLNPAEQALLQALQTLTPPLPLDQQQQLDQLTAKASRGPLESLLMLVEEQLAVVAEDLDQLYDDQFIETCAMWVIPYIGDLIRYQAVNGIAPAVASPRAEVAHTISFRRRKGTVLVMEQLARDVTGWGAHAVEFFEVLADTQNMRHLRLNSHYAPDVRRWKTGLYMDTGFDRTAHSVDVRRIAAGRGRYNVQNIGIFLWSLNAYSLTNSPAAAAKDTSTSKCFRFNPLGSDLPLFNDPVSQGTDIAAAAGPANVPGLLRRRVLCEDIQSGIGAVYYGEGNSLVVSVNGALLNPYQIMVCNLSGADGSWVNATVNSLYAAAVDPELGRIALSSTAGQSPTVQVSFHYGFNADLGGGEYARQSSFHVLDEAWVLPFPHAVPTPLATNRGNATVTMDVYAPTQSGVVVGTYRIVWSAATTFDVYDPNHNHLGAGTNAGGWNNEIKFSVSAGIVAMVAGDEIDVTIPYKTLQEALAFAVVELQHNGQIAVEIIDSNVYTVPSLEVDVPSGKTIELRAADGSRPTLVLSREIVVTGAPSSTFMMNGLVISSTATFATPSPIALVHAPATMLRPDKSQGPNLLSQLTLTHCTLVPGWALTPLGDPQQGAQATLVAEPSGLQVTVIKSILGGTRVGEFATANLADSIVDATSREGVAYAALDNINGGGALTLTGCTVVGKVHATLLSLVSNSIFWAGLANKQDSFTAPLWSDRRQSGCVRFSYLPPGALIPRRFECVEQGPQSPQPLFFSLRYGDPGYAKLLASTADAVRRGADDGGEMGAFHFVLAPSRESDLRVRMQEYIPVGLEFGINCQN